MFDSKMHSSQNQKALPKNSKQYQNPVYHSQVFRYPQQQVINIIEIDEPKSSMHSNISQQMNEEERSSYYNPQNQYQREKAFEKSISRNDSIIEALKSRTISGGTPPMRISHNIGSTTELIRFQEQVIKYVISDLEVRIGVSTISEARQRLIYRIRNDCSSEVECLHLLTDFIVQLFLGESKDGQKKLKESMDSFLEKANSDQSKHYFTKIQQQLQEHYNHIEVESSRVVKQLRESLKRQMEIVNNLKDEKQELESQIFSLKETIEKKEKRALEKELERVKNKKAQSYRNGKNFGQNILSGNESQNVEQNQFYEHAKLNTPSFNENETAIFKGSNESFSDFGTATKRFQENLRQSRFGQIPQPNLPTNNFARSTSPQKTVFDFGPCVKLWKKQGLNYQQAVSKGGQCLLCPVLESEIKELRSQNQKLKKIVQS